MPANLIEIPYMVFPDVDGDPLKDGFIYVGKPNLDAETNQVSVYWDADLTIPAAQPIRTINGYPSRSGSPGRLYCDGDFSIKVRNKNGSFVYSLLTQPTLPIDKTSLGDYAEYVFPTVADMKASSLLLVGTKARTLGYDAIGDGGHGEYTIVSPATGTDDGGLFHDLNGGNQAKLIHSDEVRVRQFGVFGSDPTNDKVQCQKAVATLLNVHFDVPLITIPTLASGEALFQLTSEYSHLKYRGPCRFKTDGVLARYNYLFEPKGCSDITVEDIFAEDTVNKSSVMTAQGGLVYCGVNDYPSTEDRGCFRFRMVRPAIFGGGALFQPIGVTYGTSANQCSIIDGHAEDTYYALNCAASGAQLKANLRCIRVNRAYFPYDVSGQDVIIDSEDPGSSNAHFLLKTYNPAKGLRDITAVLRIKGDTSAGLGRLVFEQQDEATDDSIIENIDVTLFDERTLDTESVFFRAYENPTTERAVTNSVWRNITIRGQAKGLRFFSKSTKPVVLQWLASDPKNGSYIGASDIFSYQKIFQNGTYCEVLFKQGVDKYSVAIEGVPGTGLDYLFPIGKILQIADNTSITLRFKVTAFQGSSTTMTNHSSYEFDALCRLSGGVVTLTKGADRNGITTAGAVILATVTASGDQIRFQAGVLGGSQFLLLDVTLI